MFFEVYNQICPASNQESSLLQYRSFKVLISISFPNQRLKEELDVSLVLNSAPIDLS